MKWSRKLALAWSISLGHRVECMKQLQDMVCRDFKRAYWERMWEGIIRRSLIKEAVWNQCRICTIGVYACDIGDIAGELVGGEGCKGDKEQGHIQAVWETGILVCMLKLWLPKSTFQILFFLVVFQQKIHWGSSHWFHTAFNYFKMA